MKYYWINIDSSVYRKIFMELQFNLSNINNQRISAITPELLSQVLEDKPPYKCGNSVCNYNDFRDCPFEFSCICSHLTAIKEGYNSGEDYFIVCEDDIYFPFKINYDDLLLGDKNAILVAARILGYGSEYSFEYENPVTEEKENGGARGDENFETENS